jgi:two-component system, OmpR family, sensor kinase
MLAIVLFGDLPDPNQLSEERYRSAELLMNYAGPSAVAAATAEWPEEARAALRRHVAAERQPPTTIERPPMQIGARYWGYAIHIVIGVAGSLLLALYLARPVRWLRDGFRRITNGELDTRLAPYVGKRRDELADLAHDFDFMAGRLQTLISDRERILHDLSHELRSPLARLGVAVGLVRQDRTFSNETLDRIEAECVRLNSIVGNFLMLSRLENQTTIEERFFDVADLLRVVCDDARFEAQPRRVAVQLQLSPELDNSSGALVMRGAPELFRSALDNIIRNAVRFSPPGEVVTVEGLTSKEGLQIEVRDRGPGAPQPILTSMFDPFVKGDGETQGIGLGLAIARRAISAHGGTLQASQGQEGGLTMTLLLPYSKPSESSEVGNEKGAWRLTPTPP